MHRVRMPKEDDPIIRQHLAKFDKLFPALALIFHLVDCVAHGVCGPVSEDSALRAAAWCEFLEAHARRCYGLLKDDGMRAAQALAAKLDARSAGRGVHTSRCAAQSVAQPDHGRRDSGGAGLAGGRRLASQRACRRHRPEQRTAHIALSHQSRHPRQAQGGRGMNWLERARREIRKSTQSGAAVAAETGVLAVLAATHPALSLKISQSQIVPAAIPGCTAEVSEREPTGDDPQSWRHWYQERLRWQRQLAKAAGRSDASAQALAYGEMQLAWHNRHGERSDPSRCAGCGGSIASGRIVETLADRSRVHASNECWIAYGKRWRAAAARGLLRLGILGANQRKGQGDQDGQ